MTPRSRRRGIATNPTLVVPGEEDHDISGRLRVTLELVENRSGLIGLLVKDDRVTIRCAIE